MPFPGGDRVRPLGLTLYTIEGNLRSAHKPRAGKGRQWTAQVCAAAFVSQVWCQLHLPKAAMQAGGNPGV